MADDGIGWGILGPGRIARRFVEGLSVVEDVRLVAVGSRSLERAEIFGKEFGIPNRYGSYEALAEDPDVDVVYVATPHTSHKEHSLLCLRAGKHVLCEKPLTVNAAECEELICAAHEQGRFLMEAMWTRFFPVMCKLRELVSERAIGDVRMVSADFGFHSAFDPASRIFDPELGGGGLLDVGVYTVSFAHMVLGRPPAEIAALADIGETGVDEQAAIVLKFDRGEMALLFCGVRTQTVYEARIYGTDGMIYVEPSFWSPDAFTITRGGESERIAPERVGNGFNYEAAEVASCIRNGKLESDIMPLAESLQIMETMDAIRRIWHLTYPCEREATT
jgi:predicted dehydrogenase